MINLTIQNTIQNTIRNTLGDVAFDMLDLFSGGQQGVWYDPSDLATMYQESTGVTPVTANGQAVGLMLDKSVGDVLGDELILSNDFTGWVSDDTSVLNVEADGTVTVNAGDGIVNTFLRSPPINLEIGKTYFVKIAADNYIEVGLGFYTKSTGGPNSYAWDRNFVFTCTESPEVLRLFRFRDHTGTGTINNISVKEVQGIPAQQPVSTQRPTYNATPDRLTLDLVDDSLAFTVPTGGIDGYMVVGTDDGTASYGVSLPAGDYDIGGDYFMGGSVNGFLLREGDMSASDLRNVEKDFVSKGAKASYGDVTDFTNYWRDKGITEFPLIDTSNGTNFNSAWNGNNLTGFPLIDTSNVTNFQGAWFENNLTSFPLINTSSGTNFSYTWYNNNLTSFPLIDTSSGTIFSGAWQLNNLTSFPLLDTSNVTNFGSAWRNNSTLADFPANMFDNCLCTNFTSAFASTGLSQSSIDGILVSIESNGTSNGTFGQSGGSAPSATGEAAINALVTRGWTVNVTGGYQGKVLPEGLFENDENGFWYSMDIGE